MHKLYVLHCSGYIPLSFLVLFGPPHSLISVLTSTCVAPDCNISADHNFSLWDQELYTASEDACLQVWTAHLHTSENGSGHHLAYHK